MNTPAALSATDALCFRNFLVRSVLIDGVPYFYAADLGAALNNPLASEAALRKTAFPAFARREIIDPEQGSTTIVSPVGAWFLTEMVSRLDGQSLAAWTRRESHRQWLNPDPSDPAMFLTILPDRCLPPRPGKYSGRLAEWEALRDSPEGQNVRGRWPECYAAVCGHIDRGEAAIMERLQAAARSQEA